MNARVLVSVMAWLGGVAAGCERPIDAPEIASAAAVEVRVAKVRRGDIAETLNVAGETAALSVVRLASPVAGRVTWLAVRAGDHLGADEVAARVMPLENEAALHGFAVLDGHAMLGADDRAMAQHLQRDLRAGDIPLRAPFPAVVAERQRNPGEQVASGDIVLELFDPRSLYVVAHVPAESAGRVHAGMPVDVNIGRAVVSGTVAAVVTAMVPQTLTVPIRISLAAPLETPLLHAAVQCAIIVARRAGAPLIPRSALLPSSATEHGLVMVAVGGRVQQRQVRLGLRTADDVEVVDGLAVDDLVLADGHYSLPNGTVVESSESLPSSPE